MTEITTSAPGFMTAWPDQATQVAPLWEYRVPGGESQGSATFPPSFRALDAPLVHVIAGAPGDSGRPLPRLGVARSTTGRATDVDNFKAAPFERR